MAENDATRAAADDKARMARILGATDRDVARALAGIAAEFLGLETLEARNTDGFDFTDQAVWSIRRALEAAYEAGQNSTSATMRIVRKRIEDIQVGEVVLRDVCTGAFVVSAVEKVGQTHTSLYSDRAAPEAACVNDREFDVVGLSKPQGTCPKCGDDRTIQPSRGETCGKCPGCGGGRVHNGESGLSFHYVCRGCGTESREDK